MTTKVRISYSLISLFTLLICSTPSPVYASFISGTTMYKDKSFMSVKKTTAVYANKTPYQANTSIDLRVDIYEPEGDTRTSRPAIVLVHGGGFAVGSRGLFGSGQNAFGWGEYLAERGYVVFSIDYRHMPEMINYTSPLLKTAEIMATSDAIDSIIWIRNHATQYKINTDKIAIGGQSAGAIIALYTAYRAAPTNEKVQAVFSLAGAMGEADLPQIIAGMPPASLYSGALDHQVPYAWQLATKNKINSVGIPVEWHFYPDKGHEVSGYKQVIPEITQFLYDKLKPDTQGQTPTSGDLNNDGVINLLDYIKLKNNFGNPYTLLDFIKIKNNFNQ